MAFTTPEDVAARYGPFTPDQTEKLPYLIGDIEAELGLGRNLAARVADGRTTRALVVRVVSELCNEGLRNPLGLRSHSQTTGSFTDHYTYGGDPTAEAALTPRQKRLLGDRRPGGAYTVNPAGSATTPPRRLP